MPFSISIHAARVGCDADVARMLGVELISIHAARVGCDHAFHPLLLFRVFISIHAARVGCDGCTLGKDAVRLQFQSTQPEWAATEV